MNVSAQFAEEHFSDILHTAMMGEDVEIATPEQRTVRLTLVQTLASQQTTSAIRPLGRLKGLFELPTDEEWAAKSQELADLMLNAPIVSSREI
jgi:antitoxin (DNA-binding transcriptional repressor) of toxin-antitoxin stability system